MYSDIDNRKLAQTLKNNLLKDKKYKPIEQSGLNEWGLVADYCMHIGGKCNYLKIARDLLTEGVEIYTIDGKVVNVLLKGREIKFTSGN